MKNNKNLSQFEKEILNSVKVLMKLHGNSFRAELKRLAEVHNLKIVTARTRRGYIVIIYSRNGDSVA